MKKKDIFPGARSTDDKRKTDIVLTQKGTHILDAVPPLLQERFTKRFSELERWEQLMIESAFERVVSMMSTQDFDAAPTMRTGDEK